MEPCLADYEKSEYRYLKIILSDICLFHNIVHKQICYCDRYPDKLKEIRNLYMTYPTFDERQIEVENFVRYLEMVTKRIISVPYIFKKEDIYKDVYNFTSSGPHKDYLIRILHTINMIIMYIRDSFIKNFDFEMNFVKFSSMNAVEFFKDVYLDAVERSLFDREQFMKSYFFKSYIVNDYNIINLTDSIDQKLNGKNYDEFTEMYTKMLFNIN